MRQARRVGWRDWIYDPTTRRLLLATPLVLLLVAAGQAQGQPEKLKKADARLAAELAAYDYTTHRDYLTHSQIGACRRLSLTRFLCRGLATGDEFKGCDTGETFECHYLFHRCRFNVAVHRAGYSALGRIREARCTAREHV